jgi:hypothetical protein
VRLGSLAGETSCPTKQRDTCWKLETKASRPGHMNTSW